MPIESTEASFKLQDRTALLCGPCNTVNQSIAVKLTQLGCNVAMLDRNTERTQRFADQLMDAREINEKYGRAIAVLADLSKLHHVQDAVSRSAEAFGGIDIYIDGIMTNEPKTFTETSSLDDIDRLIDVNLKAPLMMTHSVMRFLQGRKRGRIIYLMHDIIRLGVPGNSLLAMTRTGLSAFARTLAREVAESNVTVNCVAMGVTEEYLMGQAKAMEATKSSIQEWQKKLLE
ncbi:MAG TPA: SDR family oxidoreductase, partial [Bdellovibrionales bacterium]|nr:SDR family oxidoreductase [Bdellovibrionales bacterium]